MICVWGTVTMQVSEFFWRTHDSHPPGWPTCHWYRTSCPERQISTAWAKPYRWMYFKPKPLQHWSQREIFHTLDWRSITSILLHLLLILEVLLPLISFEISFSIIHLSVLARPMGTCRGLDFHPVTASPTFPWDFAESFPAAAFPSGALTREPRHQIQLQETWQQRSWLPDLADSDLTEELFLHPGMQRGFLHSFKSNRIKQPQSRSFTFLLSLSHNIKGIWLFFTPVLDSLHLPSGPFSEDILIDTPFSWKQFPVTTHSKSEDQTLVFTG